MGEEQFKQTHIHPFFLHCLLLKRIFSNCGGTRIEESRTSSLVIAGVLLKDSEFVSCHAAAHGSAVG